MISIVIPAHNEEKHIAETLDSISRHVRTPHEVIVIADHCCDRTEEIVRSFLNIQLLRNEGDQGFSNTVIAGIRAARGDAVVLVMADGCDDLRDIDHMWDVLQQQHADVVCGSRYMKNGKKIGGPHLQNLLSRTVCSSLHLLARIPTRDAANAFKMYRRSFLEILEYNIENTGTEYSLALLLRTHRAGGKIIDIPTIWTGRSIPLRKELAILKRLPGYLSHYLSTLR